MFVRSLGRLLPRACPARPGWGFAQAVADPYYILGIDKSADYDAIKKTFYTLAHEYHPDRNPSPDAARQFILIKEAFEAIRLQRGMSVAQNLEKSPEQESAEQSSRRPNPEQYERPTDEGTFEQRSRDYKMEAEKAPLNPEYEKLRKSFEAIHDINDIKVRVEDGVMWDPSERFGLDQFRGKISIFKKNGTSYILLLGAGLGFFFLLSNAFYSGELRAFSRRETILGLQKAGGNELQGNDDISAAEYESLQQDPLYRQYQRRQEASQSTGLFSLKLHKQDAVFDATQRTDVV